MVTVFMCSRDLVRCRRLIFVLFPLEHPSLFFSVFFGGEKCIHFALAIFDKDASHFLLCRHPPATLSNNALPLSFCFHHPDIFSNVAVVGLVLYVRPDSTAFQNRASHKKQLFLFSELPTVLHMVVLCTSEGRWWRRRQDEEWKEERFAR